MRFNARKGRFTKANASRLGKLGAAANARKRMESPREDEPRRVPEGELLGILSWHSADGMMRRWTIRQGNRANNIRVIAKGKSVVCGWDRFLRTMRRHLSITKRVFEP